MPLAALLATAGCGEPTAPKATGRFILTSLNGQAAPLVWFDHTFSSGERLVHTILADTLILRSGGTSYRSEAHSARSIAPDGTIVETMSAEAGMGVYGQEGDRVIHERVTIYSSTGARQADTLVFRNGGLEQTKRLGLFCSTGTCPPPRDFLLRYERR